MEPTPTFQLADMLLAGRLREIVEQQRAEGRSWRKIAQDLWVQTGGKVDITHETLRSWFSTEVGAA